MSPRLRDSSPFQPFLGRSRALHLLYLACMVVLIAGISFWAVFNALGYEINLPARTIEQTGIMYLESVRPNLEADVYIDGQKVSSFLPYRYSHVPPGTYAVEIKSPGNQSWIRQVTVEANRVESFRSILLIRQNPLPLTAQSDDATYFTQNPLNKSGLDIRSGDEIWLNGNYITRTTADISQIYWYPDQEHLVYQAGDTLWLSEVDGYNTEQLVKLGLTTPVKFTFRKNGRVLVYQAQTGSPFSELELY